MPKTYDTIIIGAGIAGATLARTLTQQNQNVLVVDKNGIASGGAGAAGAFVLSVASYTSMIRASVCG